MEQRLHDQESYEYWFNHVLSLELRPILSPSDDDPSIYEPSPYVMKLLGQWSHTVQARHNCTIAFARRETIDRCTYYYGEDSPYHLVHVDADVMAALRECMSKEQRALFTTPVAGPLYRPTPAKKDLNSSTADFFGYNPHPDVLSPKHDEYPVIYFLYGRLSDPHFHAFLLGIPHNSSYIEYRRKAFLEGVTSRLWEGARGLDTALVRGGNTDRYNGWAYEVHTKEHEDLLLAYATDRFKVVRCYIYCAQGNPQWPGAWTGKNGLAFEFLGERI